MICIVCYSVIMLWLSMPPQMKTTKPLKWRREATPSNSAAICWIFPRLQKQKIPFISGFDNNSYFLLQSSTSHKAVLIPNCHVSSHHFKHHHHKPHVQCVFFSNMKHSSWKCFAFQKCCFSVCCKFFKKYKKYMIFNGLAPKSKKQ